MILISLQPSVATEWEISVPMLLVAVSFFLVKDVSEKGVMTRRGQMVVESKGCESEPERQFIVR